MCGACRKNNFFAKAGIEKGFYQIPCLLISVGRLLRKRMDPTVNIGILISIIMHQGIDYLLGFLARGRIVKINQRLIVHLSEQDGEIGSYFVNCEAHSD
jgi:hypothetical protein